MKTRAELADFAPVEPRCRVCQDPAVRRLVNDLLDWRGVPIILGRGKTHRVTYSDILRHLQPLNEGRDSRDRITYDSLWIHAKRHYDVVGTTAYCRPTLQQSPQPTEGITPVNDDELQPTEGITPVNDDYTDDDMEWACALCGFRSPETTVFDRHFHDAHPVEWQMAELTREPN